MRLTGLGKLLLVITALLYVASVTSQSSLLLALIGIIAGCFALNLIGAHRTVKAAEVNAPEVQFVAEEERLSQPWTIRNSSRFAAGFIQIASPAGVLLRIARLDPNERASAVPNLTLHRRGVHRHRDLAVQSTFPFGLAEARRRIGVPGEIVVYPALYPVETPPAAGYDIMVGGKHQGSRRTTSGAHFAGVRPFQPGDPLKQIHWKASSKGLGLMVKTYDEELSGRVGLVIDAGHNGEAETLDDCLRAAGSLMFAALDEGQHVEWIDLTNLEWRLAPPFDDGHQILEALARLELKPQCQSAASLRQAADSMSHKCALGFVMTAVTPALCEVAAELSARGRRVAVYLPLGTPIPAEGIPARLFRYEKRAIEALP